MSTSLSEVISAGGYDLSTREDCEWLLLQQDHFKELVEEAEGTIERLDEEAIENCEHEDTWTDTVEDTAEYELGVANGSNPILHTTEIEICNFCGKQRNLPEGDWENV